MDKIKHISTFILTIVFFNLKAQTTTFGAGLSSSIYFPSIYQAVPSIPLTPYFNFKIKRHEFLLGPDLFSLSSHHTITGGQFGYRFHFLKENKITNLFVDFNFQYVEFLPLGCGRPVPYYETKYNGCADVDFLYKFKSFVNTYGLGFQIHFLKRFNLYVIAGGGYNYCQSEKYERWSYDAIKDKNYTKLIGYARGGLSFDIYQKKKSEACYGVIPEKESDE